MATSTSLPHPPHPLLKEPVLYVADVPSHLEWDHLLRALSCCDRILSKGRSSVVGTQRTKWTIQFSSLFHAEMALATLQGMPIPGLSPPWSLALSHSPFLQEPLPERPLLPLFVKTDVATHAVLIANAQTVFTWFRATGPLVTVRVGVDVGYAHPTCVLEYWEEQHAQAARSRGQDISMFTRGTMPFTLRVFDPLKLYCARLGSSFGESDFAEMFSKFGKVKKAHLMKVSSPTTYGFISFESQDEAAIAIKATKGTSQGGHEIIVRYYEPTAQFLSHPPGFGAKRSFFPCIASSNISGPATCNAPGVDAGNNGNDTTKQEEPRQQDKEKEEKDARLKKAQQKREVADAAEQVAQKEREMAEKEEADKANQFALALEALEDAEKSSDFAELRLNCAEADLAEQKRLLKKAVLTLQEARDKREWAKNRVNDTFIAKEVALGEQQQAKRRREEAEHEVMRWRDEKVRAETEERQAQADILGVEEDEEARRKEELAESIRKMQELRKLEEEDKARKQCETEMAEFRRRMAELEAAEKEAARLAKEESKRKAREEEQKARELREREAAQEAARKAELDRKEAYYQAAAKETTRCKLRDESRWVQHIPWNLHFGLARFKLASAEFDDIRFNETQPLTFESVPWPTLLSPYKVTLEDIDWQIVEAFFVKVQLVMAESEYKILVEKTHRRFHPDKWKARGLLNTVLDETLRGQLESTGNIVAQAMTPIWMKSRSR